MSALAVVLLAVSTAADVGPGKIVQADPTVRAAALEDAVAKKLRSFADCVVLSPALRDEGKGEKVQLRFMIARSGAVERTTAAYFGVVDRGCVQEVARQWKFSADVVGHGAVTYEFRFTANTKQVAEVSARAASDFDRWCAAYTAEKRRNKTATTEARWPARVAEEASKKATTFYAREALTNLINVNPAQHEQFVKATVDQAELKPSCSLLKRKKR